MATSDTWGTAGLIQLCMVIMPVIPRTYPHDEALPPTIIWLIGCKTAEEVNKAAQHRYQVTHTL